MLVACEQDAVPTAPSPAAAPPTAVAQEAPDPDLPLLEYMRAIGPVAYDAANGASHGIADCIDDEERAPESAEAAAECLRERITAHGRAMTQLASVTAPADMLARQRELVALAQRDEVALRAIVGAVDELAERIDHARHRRPLPAFYGTDHRLAVELARRINEATGDKFQRWMDWISAMNPICNERLRCISGGAREMVTLGRTRGMTGNPPFQNNCPCPRIWTALGRVGGEAIFTARQSGLPPFRGGIL